MITYLRCGEQINEKKTTPKRFVVSSENINNEVPSIFINEGGKSNGENGYKKQEK